MIAILLAVALASPATPFVAHRADCRRFCAPQLARCAVLHARKRRICKSVVVALCQFGACRSNADAWWDWLPKGR